MLHPVIAYTHQLRSILAAGRTVDVIFLFSQTAHSVVNGASAQHAIHAFMHYFTRATTSTARLKRLPADLVYYYTDYLCGSATAGPRWAQKRLHAPSNSGRRTGSSAMHDVWASVRAKCPICLHKRRNSSDKRLTGGNGGGGSGAQQFAVTPECRHVVPTGGSPVSAHHSVERVQCSACACVCSLVVCAHANSRNEQITHSRHAPRTALAFAYKARRRRSGESIIINNNRPAVVSWVCARTCGWVCLHVYGIRNVIAATNKRIYSTCLCVFSF